MRLHLSLAALYLLSGCAAATEPESMASPSLPFPPSPPHRAFPELRYGTTATYQVTGPTLPDASANQTIPRITLTFTPGKPFPRADGLLVETYNIQTTPVLWNHEGTPMLVYRDGLNRFALNWTESVSAFMETPHEMIGTPGEIRMDRYSEPGAVVPLLDPVLLGMYATLHLGFANAAREPMPTSSVRQEVSFDDSTQITLTLQETGVAHLEDGPVAETRIWTLRQTYDSEALPLRIQAESRIERGDRLTLQTYSAERQDLQPGDGPPIAFRAGIPPPRSSHGQRNVESIAQLDGTYKVPPAGGLPWFNFTGALDMAIRQRQLGGALGSAYATQVAWLHAPLSIPDGQGHETDPAGTEAMWVIGFLPVPVPDARKSTISVVTTLEQHANGAAVYLPWQRADQQWPAVPGYAGPLSPLLSLEDAVKGYRAALGVPEEGLPDQVWYSDAVGFGFKESGVHWRLGSGCRDDDGRDATVLFLDATTGYLSGAFYDRPHAGTGACDPGPLPF